MIGHHVEEVDRWYQGEWNVSNWKFKTGMDPERSSVWRCEVGYVVMVSFCDKRTDRTDDLRAD